MKVFYSNADHEINFICCILKKVFSMILLFLPLETCVRKGPKILVPGEYTET
jgi:hypothetical protein